MIELVQEADRLALKIVRFAGRNNIPLNWLGKPDHVAWKTTDSIDYDMIIEEIRENSKAIYEIQLNERRIATAQLISSLILDKLGSVNLLEIMEPRPEMIGKDRVGLEHIEFVTSLAPMRYKLGLRLKQQSNEHHDWFTYRFRGGQEMKFTDRPLGQLLKQQKKSGQAYLI